MPTFIKPGFWEKAKKGYRDWLNLDDLIASKPSASGQPGFQQDVINYGGTTAAGIAISTGSQGGPIVFWSREIVAPNVVSITGSIYIYENTSPYDSILNKISLPSLDNVGSLVTNPPIDVIFIKNFLYLETINFSSLRTIYNGSIVIEDNPVLTTLNLESLHTLVSNAYLQIRSNSSLSKLSFPNLTNFDGSVDLSNNALDQESIDGILYQLANVVNLQNQFVSLSGGTNAAPSVTGATYVATLTANGCTVITN